MEFYLLDGVTECLGVDLVNIPVLQRPKVMQYLMVTLKWAHVQRPQVL